jgi:hypothetical protein
VDRFARSPVTTLKDQNKNNPLANALEMLVTIWEHHPSVTELHVAGLLPKDVYRKDWEDFGLTFARSDATWAVFQWTHSTIE